MNDAPTRPARMLIDNHDSKCHVNTVYCMEIMYVFVLKRNCEEPASEPGGSAGAEWITRGAGIGEAVFLLGGMF